MDTFVVAQERIFFLTFVQRRTIPASIIGVREGIITLTLEKTAAEIHIASIDENIKEGQMKQASIFLLGLLMAGCISEEDRMWYHRLNAVDSGRISDSAIWAISKDHEMVQEIEHLAAESVAYVRVRQSDDSVYHATPVNTTDYPVTVRYVDTLVHSALMEYDDSIDAAETLRGDSVALNLDSLTLAARSGDFDAQMELEMRHSIEGDINGAWTSSALSSRDSSMRKEITELKTRIARSDSAKAMLARLDSK